MLVRAEEIRMRQGRKERMGYSFAIHSAKGFVLHSTNKVDFSIVQRRAGLNRRARCSMTEPKSTSNLIEGRTLPIIATTSAILGPLLDNYHSQFAVLKYENAIEIHQKVIQGLSFDLTTSIFTPPLFIIAGLAIATGTLYVNDKVKLKRFPNQIISIPQAMATVSAFSSIYYLSASLPSSPAISIVGPLLCAMAFLEWYLLDKSIGGLIMGILTGIGGPVVEMILINFAHMYVYTSPEWMNIPLFIAPVYFAGGPAVGNLARAVNEMLKTDENQCDS